jgi:hypothetical protein
MNTTSNNDGIKDAIERAASFFARSWRRFCDWIYGPIEPPMSDLTLVRLQFWNGVKELETSGKFEFYYDSPDRLLPQQVADEYQAAGWRVLVCLTWLPNGAGKSYALAWIEVHAPHRREDLCRAREAVMVNIPDHILYPKRSWLNRLRGAT